MPGFGHCEHVIRGKELEVKAHYSFITRLLLDLFQSGELPNICEITVEPEYGYAGRIVYQNRSVRLFRGADVGINASSARQIAADKGYTKYFLTLLGYETPPGKVFLLPDYISALDKALARYAFQHYARVEEIDPYIVATPGYPCFIKPNEGAQGKGIYKCWNKQDVESAVAHYQRDQTRTLLVEKAITWPDYRVVVLRDEVIACYRRTPLAVRGDGISTIKELLLQKRAHLIATSRPALIDMDDTRIVRQLARSNYHLETVLPRHVVCQILDVSNLSAGGELEDFTERINQRWREMCIAVTADMGLGFCGIDLACADIESPQAEYSILEINDSPSLANYAATGEEQYGRVRGLYKKIFEKES
jgi:D-alanine-D-alanine ligase-like ATP-grasp enzyme